eukprot:6906503-Pyramimonas_sp.AAC.1
MDRLADHVVEISGHAAGRAQGHRRQEEGMDSQLPPAVFPQYTLATSLTRPLWIRPGYQTPLGTPHESESSWDFWISLSPVTGVRSPNPVPPLRTVHPGLVQPVVGAEALFGVLS